MTSDRCVVFGGAGFMSSHLLELLLSEGFRVRAFDLPGRPPRLPAGRLAELELVEGNFARDELRAVVEGCQYVFHLIGTTVPTSSNRDPVFDVESNVVGSLRLLDACVRAKVRRVVFASSGGTVYGEASQPIPETHATEPRSSYGITKLTIEKYLALFHHLHGLDYTVLRMGNVYGPGLPVSGEQGVVGMFLAQLKHGRPLVLYGDGEIARDYIYVEDVARALRAAMSQTSNFRVFNVGTGIGTTLNEMVRWLEKVTGRRAQVSREPGRPADVRANVLDISRARQHLGWSPSVSLEEGLKRTWTWILEQERI